MIPSNSARDLSDLVTLVKKEKNCEQIDSSRAELYGKKGLSLKTSCISEKLIYYQYQKFKKKRKRGGKEGENINFCFN